MAMAGPFHADNCCKIAIALIDLGPDWGQSV